MGINRRELLGMGLATLVASTAHAETDIDLSSLRDGWTGREACALAGMRVSTRGFALPHRELRPLDFPGANPLIGWATLAAGFDWDGDGYFLSAALLIAAGDWIVPRKLGNPPYLAFVEINPSVRRDEWRFIS